MTKRMIAGVLAALVGVNVATAQDEMDNGATLKVGDKAPSLSNVEWLKGDPVEEFQSGQIYVLDFWATWCGPCVASIPHINKLQEDYKEQGVNVIGVAIWPRPGMTPTDEFVEKRGDKMAYRIAEDIEGATAKAYMEAAGRNGIPTVMVIGREGKLSWIGHPMSGLDRVIKLMVDNEFDAEKFAEQERKQELRSNSLMRKYRQAMMEGDWESVLAVTDDFLEMDDEQFAGMGISRYMALVKLDRKDDAHVYGMGLVEKTMHESSDLLNALSWTIVEPGGSFEGEERDLEVALSAAKRASELTNGEDPLILDTLARAYYWKGDLEQAIKVQTKAVELSEDQRFEADLRKALEEYQAAQKSM